MDPQEDDDNNAKKVEWVEDYKNEASIHKAFCSGMPNEGNERSCAAHTKNFLPGPARMCNGHLDMSQVRSVGQWQSTFWKIFVGNVVVGS